MSLYRQLSSLKTPLSPDSPNPIDTKTIVASPTPLVVEIPAPEPVNENHPGEGWQPNICREGIAYPMQILNDEGAITIAPYLHLDLNRGNPLIEGTLGQGCPVTSHPLYATPDHYTRIMLTVTNKVHRRSIPCLPILSHAM